MEKSKNSSLKLKPTEGFFPLQVDKNDKDKIVFIFKPLNVLTSNPNPNFKV